MIDTRCYSCAKDLDKFFDIEAEESEMPKYSYMKYQGSGIFKCPECGNILDLSSRTYTIKISRVYDETGCLYTRELELDPKLSEKGIKEDFQDDMCGFDIFENLPFGKYRVEVLWYYYIVDGEDSQEWDVEIDILSEEPLEE